MANKKYPEQLIYALDIGTRSLVGTVGYREGAKYVVVAIETLEHETRAMMDGQIHDIELVAESVKAVTRKLEEKVGRKLDKVCIAAAGRVLKTVHSHTDYELPSEKVVDEEDIYTLKSLAIEDAYKLFLEENNEDTRYYCVGSSVVRYYLNDGPINKLIRHKASKLGVDLIATFLPDDVVDSLYRTVSLAGLEVASLTLEPIAAIGLAIPEKYRLLNIALVDVGAGTTDISITNGGSVVAFGMIPEAGDRITEKIANFCMTDFNTAEIIKKKCSEECDIEYTDIMGMTLSVKSEDIRSHVADVVEELAVLAADKIKELNGDKAVGAVFVVGGGGVYKGYTELLASKLGLSAQRVALRGKEVMNDIIFKDDVEADSLLVTPIGIALSYYDEVNNFIYIDFNETKVKVYNGNNLTVMDVAMQADFPAENFFPKAGDSIKYIFNGNERVARGTLGEAAEIYINGQPANMHSPVKADDIITVKNSTKGEPAELIVSSLPGYKQKIRINVNDKKVNLPKYVMVNNKLESGYYSVKEGDNVEILDYYTLKQVKEFLDVEKDVNWYCLVNNVKAEDEEKVYENFSVVIKPGNEEEAEQKEAPVKAITVSVNGQEITLTGKSSYIFVDIFDYYEFDLSTPKGEIKTTVNGIKAEYMQNIYEGDVIEVYWD